MGRRREPTGVESTARDDRPTALLRVEVAVPFDSEALVGRYAYSPGVPTGDASGATSAGSTRWWWSEEMFALHALAPGDVVPSRDVLLRHVRPDGRAAVEEALVRGERDLQPFVVPYVLVDVTGHERAVTLCGAGDARADSVVVSGFVVEATPVERARVASEVTSGLEQAIASHATIDQAKGALMLVYGIDGDTAFELLRWCSQQRNVRLATLAGRLLAAIEDTGGLPADARARMDEIIFQSFTDVTGVVPAADPTALDVRTQVVEGVPVLTVRGPVDLATSAMLTTAAESVGVEARASGALVVDLREASHLGSAAVSVLTTLARRNRNHGVRVRAVVLPGSTLLLASSDLLEVLVRPKDPTGFLT